MKLFHPVFNIISRLFFTGLNLSCKEQSYPQDIIVLLNIKVLNENGNICQALLAELQ